MTRLKDDAAAMRGPGDSAGGQAKPFPFEAAREYMQPEEQPAFKKKGRKKRLRRAAAADDDEPPAAPAANDAHGAAQDAGGADVFADLEAAGGADLGDRCALAGPPVPFAWLLPGARYRCRPLQRLHLLPGCEFRTADCL